SRKSAALLSDLLESGFNPHTSSHGLSGAELTRLPLNAPTSNQKSNCNARTHAFETDQGIDSERRDLAALNQMGVLVGLGPRLQPRKREFRPQPQLAGALPGPSLDRCGDAFFRIQMVNEDPPARLHHPVAFGKHLLGVG